MAAAQATQARPTQLTHSILRNRKLLFQAADFAHCGFVFHAAQVTDTPVTHSDLNPVWTYIIVPYVARILSLTFGLGHLLLSVNECDLKLSYQVLCLLSF